MLLAVATPVKFKRGEILDAALRAIAAHSLPRLTVAAVAGEMGGPTGSIYHRFESRDALLGELWLRTVARFQDGFVEVLDMAEDREAGLSATLFTPEWVRQHPAEARLLLLHRREDMLGRDWPHDMEERARGLGADLDRSLRTYARRALGGADRRALQRLTFALVDVPLGAVRRYVAAGKRPPAAVDDLVGLAYAAVMADDQ